MKTASVIRILSGLLFLIAAITARSATTLVLPGTKVQDTVNAAADGDVLVLLEGIYNEDVTVQGKNVRIVREKGKTVEISGSLTYRDVNGTVVIRDLKIGRDGSKHLTIDNCEKVGVEDLDLSAGGGLVITNSTVVARSCPFGGGLNVSATNADDNKTIEVIDCTFSGNLDVSRVILNVHDSRFNGGRLSSSDADLKMVQVAFTSGADSGITRGRALLYDVRFNSTSHSVTINGADWRMHECYVGESLHVTNAHTRFIRSRTRVHLYHNSPTLPDGNGTECTVFQSTVGYRLLCRAQRSWIGYNTIKYVDYDHVGSTEAEIVGNDVNGRLSDAVDLVERLIEINCPSLAVNINNNVLRNTWTGHNEGGIYGTEGKSGVWIYKCQKATIRNNEFNHLHGDCVHIQGDFGGSAEVTGNWFYHCLDSVIEAPFTNVLFTHNFWDHDQNSYPRRWVQGGVVLGEGNVKGPAQSPFPDGDLNRDHADRLAVWASIPDALKDKGPPEVHFKDHDGTRNDIGPLGGHAYDPNGKTSVKPVVLSGDHWPKVILKGTSEKINLKARAAVATPK
jgi:hypothetical protein